MDDDDKNDPGEMAFFHYEQNTDVVNYHDQKFALVEGEVPPDDLRFHDDPIMRAHGRAYAHQLGSRMA